MIAWHRTLAVALLATLAAVPARAQDDEEEVVGPGRWLEVEGHGGLLRFDGEGFAPIYGGRATVHFPNGLGVGATAGFTKRPVDFADESEDADAWIVTADFLYMLPSVTRANIYAVIGVGAARLDPSAAEEAAGGEQATEVVVPVGVGILWYAHPGGNWWGIRSEVRDNIIFLRGDPDLGTDDAISNNWELSVGLSLLFGAQ